MNEVTPAYIEANYQNARILVAQWFIDIVRYPVSDFTRIYLQYLLGGSGYKGSMKCRYLIT